MAGHSHWAQVKHKKAISDIKKGQLISKLMRGIYIALRDGNNPETNPKLRTAIERAKEFGISQETIQRALSKPEKMNVEEVLYEAVGPSGIALLIKAQTDNKNRTTGEIKGLVSEYGKLGEPGSVSWMFEEKGILKIESTDISQFLEKLADLGVEDFKDENGEIMLITDPKKVYDIKSFLEKENVFVKMADIQFLPKNPIKITNEEKEKLEKFIEKLLDHPDVESVFTNLE